MKFGVVLAVSAWLLVCSSPAWGSCGAVRSVEKQLAAANVAFVGTVTGVEDEGHSAVVRVEATWKGPRLPDQVAITSETGSGALLSNGRTWTVGERYLFMPTDDSPPFHDDACSGTRVYSSTLDRFAPPGGVPSGSPSPGPRPGSSGAGSLLAIVVFIALGAAALNQVRRVRRAALPTWHDPTVDPKDDPDLRR